MESLETLCGELSQFSILSEVWINGSFMTEKIDPEDVDLVVVVMDDSDSPFSDSQNMVLEKIRNRSFSGCDSYVHRDYPPGHQSFNSGEAMRAYWIRQYCFSRNEDMKGLAVVRTPV